MGKRSCRRHSHYAEERTVATLRSPVPSARRLAPISHESTSVVQAQQKFAPAFLSVETQNKFPGACRYRRDAACSCFEYWEVWRQMGTSHFRLA
jgi:hypothetical protein